MGHIFSNQRLDTQFRTQGYIKLNLLFKEDVQSILKVKNEKNILDENTYDPTMDKQESLEFNDFIELRDTLGSIIMKRLSTYCPELEVIFAEFLTKSPGKTKIPGHQDWIFTDRNSINTPSLSLFIALSKMNFKNGALGFIAGSHLIPGLIPQPSPDPYAPLPLIEHDELIFKYLNYIDLNAGDAVLFYNNTIHGSFSNRTKSDRIAFRLALHRKSDPLYHYYLNPNSTQEEIIQYLVDKDFFSKYRNPQLVARYKSKEELPYKEVKRFRYIYPKFSEESLENIFISLGAKPNRFIHEEGNKSKLKRVFLHWKNIIRT